MRHPASAGRGSGWRWNPDLGPAAVRGIVLPGKDVADARGTDGGPTSGEEWRLWWADVGPLLTRGALLDARGDDGWVGGDGVTL